MLLLTARFVLRTMIRRKRTNERITQRQPVVPVATSTPSPIIRELEPFRSPAYQVQRPSACVSSHEQLVSTLMFNLHHHHPPRPLVLLLALISSSRNKAHPLPAFIGSLYVYPQSINLSAVGGAIASARNVVVEARICEDELCCGCRICGCVLC